MIGQQQRWSAGGSDEAGRPQSVAGRLVATAGLATAAALAVAGGWLGGPTVVAETPNEAQAIASAQQVSLAFRAVARETLPAVVSIVATTNAAGSRTINPRSPLEDELFQRFFGDMDSFGFETDPRFRGGQPRSVGQGSGFVIDPAGVIVTNSHVVEGADEVLVEFHDGTQLSAASWHTDPWSDVAIVKLQADRPLPTLKFGDSDALEIGDWVIAFGDPFGVGTSVTTGIISGKGRAPGINHREEFLQTDAAINPGNSGGPLVNLRGEVVGVNAAISTRSGGYDGVGFAVPAKLVGRVVAQLVEHGEVRRPYLGVTVQRLTPDEGALVAQTFPGGPADAAGLKPGDVILDLDGQKVGDGVGLQGIVEQLQIGRAYPIHLIRDGQPLTLQATLQQMPDRFGDAARTRRGSGGRRETVPETGAAKLLGLEVAELTDATRESLGLDASVQGVMATVVDPAGPAAEAGVARGDVISRVGTARIASVRDFNEAVQQAGEQTSVLLHIQGARGSRFVVVKPRR